MPAAGGLIGVYVFPPLLPIAAGGGGSATVAVGPDFGVAPSTLTEAIALPEVAANYVGPTLAEAPRIVAVTAAYTGPTMAEALLLAAVTAAYVGPTLAQAPRIAAVAAAYTGPTMAEAPVISSWVVAYTKPKKDCTSHTDVPVPDPNLNGQNLTTSTVAATLEDAYLAWDFTTANRLPTNLTITAATLVLTVAIAQVGEATIDIFGIADVDEGWGETTINGASHPARSGASKQQFVVANGSLVGSTVTIALNSTVLTYLQNKVVNGAGTATLILGMNTALTTSVFRDKEDLADTPATLRVTFTTP